jgi:hypothetical protein
MKVIERSKFLFTNVTNVVPLAELLFRLGLCRHPPLEKTVDLCSSEDAKVRTSAFWYLCDNLTSKYSDYDPCNFGHVTFIPAENNDGDHLGQLGDVTRVCSFVPSALLIVSSRYSRERSGKPLVFLSFRINIEKLLSASWAYTNILLPRCSSLTWRKHHPRMKTLLASGSRFYSNVSQVGLLLADYLLR